MSGDRYQVSVLLSLTTDTCHLTPWPLRCSQKGQPHDGINRPSRSNDTQLEAAQSHPTSRRGSARRKGKDDSRAVPLSLNAVTNGCNQKNNRSPVTNLSQDQVEQAIDELRALGAVIEIQGGGRVPKYRHCMYEWLGVDKVELAVMAELLLRGEQTVGELRSRAARMEPIADLGALKMVLHVAQR